SGCYGRTGAGRRASMAGQTALRYRLFDQRCKPASGEAVMIRLVASIFFAAVAAIASANAASAMTIEKIVSPAGIAAWLVREQSRPLFTLHCAFHGGAPQDDADKAGTANLAADLLDEGAGDLDGKTFHERLENRAIELSFQVGRDYIYGSLRTLNENRDKAFAQLPRSLHSPPLE